MGWIRDLPRAVTRSAANENQEFAVRTPGQLGSSWPSSVAKGEFPGLEPGGPAAHVPALLIIDSHARLFPGARPTAVLEKPHSAPDRFDFWLCNSVKYRPKPEHTRAGDWPHGATSGGTAAAILIPMRSARLFPWPGLLLLAGPGDQGDPGPITARGARPWPRLGAGVGRVAGKGSSTGLPGRVPASLE
jgi:hypothetical protein